MSAKNFLKIFILSILVSCVSKPHRPDAPLCIADENGAICQNNQGEFHVKHEDILATTIDGYGILEKYIDSLELRIRKLERRCHK